MECPNCRAKNLEESQFCASCGQALVEASTAPISEELKRRHGCLTTWLILVIVANSLTALLYLFGSGAIREQFPDAPGWAIQLRQSWA